MGRCEKLLEDACVKLWSVITNPEPERGGGLSGYGPSADSSPGSS
jgi:hypothetical protein